VSATDGPEEPDFAGLYAGEETLSPRLAATLWKSALMLADLYSDDDMLDDLCEQLPRVVQHLADRVWMERFVECFAAIAAALARGHPDSARLASCTGEEMALHLVIDFAESATDEQALEVDERLPVYAEVDNDFDWARDILFRDHDVLLLFDESVDGVEDPESEASKHYRFANLHPSRWFLPFGHVHP
jgi:hypothetical protein